MSKRISSKSSSKKTLLFKTKHFVFAPKLIPTIVMLILLPILLKLGMWQLHRAAYKKELATQLSAHLHSSAIFFNNINALDHHPAYAHVQIKGIYDNPHQIFIDNKMNNHRVGYEILTPLVIATNSPLLLVNRGWIPQTGDRSKLPEIKPILDQQNIDGILQPPPNKIFLLAKQTFNGEWPWLVQAIDLKIIAKNLQRPVYPYILLLSPKNKHGFVREWQLPLISPYKHYGYAFQWFALAVTLVIIYLVVNTHRRTT